MFSAKKKVSIVSILRDRELNINYPLYFASLKIVRELICYKSKELYTKSWTKIYRGFSSYANGIIYFQNDKKYCFLNAVNRCNTDLPTFFSLENTHDIELSPALFHKGNVVSEYNESACRCISKRCNCLSPFLITLSSDHWLYQHLMENGKLIIKVYLNGDGLQVKVRFFEWDTYGERFSIFTEHQNTSASLTVFTICPIEFFARMEIKHSVFGNNVKLVSVSHRCLLLNFMDHCTAIYDFDEFIRGGTLTSYKLGEVYENEGKIGSYPTGLPVNFLYKEAPPVLFIVDCSRSILFQLGNYPLHYITVHPKENSIVDVRVTELKTNTLIKFNKPWLINYNAECDELLFHPDGSNRIILKTPDSVDIYNMTIKEGNAAVSKQFSFHFEEKPPNLLSTFQSEVPSENKYSVLSFDYESGLNIFAILIRLNNEALYVNMYDNTTGEILRTIELLDVHFSNGKCKLFIDLFAVVIFEIEHGVHVIKL